MALTTISDVRLLTNLTTSDISDANVTSLIGLATAEIFTKINIKVVREKIAYIDATRKNDIDGVNKTYYVRNWKGAYLSDSNFDGNVTILDVKVHTVDSNNTETEATISSITYNQGKFVLSNAYDSSYDLYVTYSYCYYDPVTPDPLLKLATTYLVASYSYLKTDAGVSDIKFGNVRINKQLSSSYGMYYDRYLDIMSKLNSYGSVGGNLDSNWIESNVKI
jgi:hypothetical protein